MYGVLCRPLPLASGNTNANPWLICNGMIKQRSVIHSYAQCSFTIFFSTSTNNVLVEKTYHLKQYLCRRKF